ncbi:MAG: low specificity L-threonine aldolase [Alphaproteobacteria bacterium]|nr:low specificity L-threonine aldolase [Alphaproteobacteria bacterium]
MQANFASDNVSPAAPSVMAALVAANAGPAMPYGADPWSERLTETLSALFECEVTVFTVATGTAANALALSLLSPPWGAVYCHPDSHAQVDECGAPEFWTGGAKLVGVGGDHGKIDPAALDATIDAATPHGVHNAQPAALTITQASEAGTVYTPDEVAALAAVAHKRRLGLHMDGARFANAVAALGCAPADITWRAGIDVLSLGATKGGALAAEAVVLFKPELAEEAGFRRKRAGHLWSKSRFLAAQLEGWLADGAWLALARHANACAARLATVLENLPGVMLLHPCEANEVFAELPASLAASLGEAGHVFYPFGAADAGRSAIRLVTAWSTTTAEVEDFLADAGRMAGRSVAA